MGTWGSEVDITETIVSRLPAYLCNVLQEIEAALGRRVRFIRVDRLPRSGGAMAHIDDGQPFVRLKSGVETNESVLAEELFHLKRRTDGHPGVKATYSGELQEYGIVCDGLTGLLDEHSFFPCLESLGYDPYSENEHVLQKYIGKFSSGFLTRLPRVRRQSGETSLEHHWVCKFALEYARMYLLTKDSNARKEFLRFYDHPDLHVARDRGRQIAEPIRSNPDQSSSGTSCLLETILRCVLELPGGTYEIMAH